MHFRLALAGLAAALILGPSASAAQPPGRPGGPRATTIPPGAACPPGTTEIRPRTCQAPELAPPSIVDYRPHSTLVAPAHPRQRAKYPAIDFHGHPQGLLDDQAGLDRLGLALDSLNVRMMVVADNMSGERAAARAAHRARVADA